MEVDAYILIGGRSSRLGQDKAFVQIEGEILAIRVSRIVKSAFPSADISFIAARDGQFERSQLEGLPYPVIYDKKPGHGAWSGFHSALAHARSEWIFLTACDYPFISPELLRLLTMQSFDGCDAVITRQTDGRLQPLCAFYRVNATLSHVEGALAKSADLPPLVSLFDIMNTRVIDPEKYRELENSDNFFVNINTMDDLRSLHLSSFCKGLK